MQQIEPNDPQSSGIKVWNSVADQTNEVGSFVRSGTASILNFIGKHLVSFLLAMLLGGLLAYGMWLIQPRIYYAEMTVSYQHYEKKIYADMIEKLDHLIQSEDYQSLADQLKLPEDLIAQLTSIETFNIKREPLIHDLSTERVPFYIRAGSLSPEVFSVLQPALVSFLDDTEFIRQRMEYIDSQNREKLKFYQTRLDILDTLTNAIINNPALQTTYDPETVMKLHQEVISLYERINELKGSIFFNFNIEVLDGFVPRNQPALPALFVFLFYGMLFGLAGRLAAIILFGS